MPCFIILYRSKEICMSSNTTKERCPLSVSILYNMCLIRPQTKTAVKSHPGLCTASIENYVSHNTSKERHEVLVMLPS